MIRSLRTSVGDLVFPTFLPVTTFGGKYPTDDLVRPYLPRLTSAIMVSHYYAQKMSGQPQSALFIDSGGFASLFEGSEIIETETFASIRTRDGTELNPPDILSFQEQHAQIGATLDFLIPPNLSEELALERQNLTIKNAVWAVQNLRSQDLKLFASIQAWDRSSALRIMETLAPYPFHGFALGGMVPRIRRPEIIFEIVRAIRSVEEERSLHVFGIGQPELVASLLREGVDSVDSSSFVRSAAEKRYLDPVSGHYCDIMDIVNTGTTCPCTICTSFEPEYFSLSGETNTMALALHNLIALLTFLGVYGN